MSFKNVLSLLMLLYAGMASAQTVTQSDTSSTDLTTRVGFELEKPIGRFWSLLWEEEARFKSNSSTFDRIYSGLTSYYGLSEYFKVGAGYTLMAIWHDGKKKSLYEKYWDYRHRANVDLAASYTYMQWKFSLRERMQMTVRTDEINTAEKTNPTYILRSKLGAEYSFFNKPLKPYLTVEFCNTLNTPDYVDENYINSIRNQIGLKWKLDRRSSLDFYYRFDINTNKDVEIDYKKDKETIKGVAITNEKEYTHILGVVYKFDWK